MKSFFFSPGLMKICWINSVLFLSFGLSAQINRVFLTLKPVVNTPVYCSGSQTAVVDVLNPATGRTWMDRNLGASQAAMSSTDALAYGDLYQWGRFSDGHQCRTSGTTTTNSATDTPSHPNFILETITPFDWRVPSNNNLWQGVSGINNPCPTGYRLPTDAELNAERLSWGADYNAAKAFGSPLKFTAAGYRERTNGLMNLVGVEGHYWTSTVSTGFAGAVIFDNVNGFMVTDRRAFGYSMRCIKE